MYMCFAPANNCLEDTPGKSEEESILATGQGGPSSVPWISLPFQLGKESLETVTSSAFIAGQRGLKRLTRNRLDRE